MISHIIVIMSDRKNIFILARTLIKKHGEGAEDYAYEVMIRFIKKNDVKEASKWLGISSAIDDLQRLKHQGKLH